MQITPCWNDKGGVRIWRSGGLVNVKTETAFAGQIGEIIEVLLLTRRISNS